MGLAARLRAGRFARAAGLSACLTAAVSAHAPAGAPNALNGRPDQTPAACGRPSARGADLVCADGSRFHWRGVTAFALLEQIAHGRGADADAYMRWARETGFNLVRVLAMADVLFALPPGEGRRHLAALFERAHTLGLYVEIVALADTARYEMTAAELRDQVAAVGRAAAAHANAIVQIANEHYHSTQSRVLHDPAAFVDLAAVVPPQVLFTASAALRDTAAEPQGAFITRHLSRSETPPRMLERVQLLGRLAERTGKPVVSGEPIGAAERDEPGRRLSDPAFFGELARRISGAGLAGGTFHCEDGLRSRVPGPVQQACARAYVEGARLQPGAHACQGDAGMEPAGVSLRQPGRTASARARPGASGPSGRRFP
jgi:hypothetical protein